MTLISSSLARFIHETKWEDIPVSIQRKAIRHFADSIGSALAGAVSEESRIFQKMLAACGELQGNSPLWGTGKAVSARNAALGNGMNAHAFELDDTGGCDHSGAVVVPAVMAAASVADRPISGKTLLLATVLGYDIARRALEACGAYEPHNGAGFHSTGTCGPIGAAAACSVILRLNEKQTQSAIGIATSYSAGFWACAKNGAQNKRLHPGNAASGGLTAALLAKNGFLGPDHAFEEVWGGFSKTLAPLSNHPEAWLSELGSNWKLKRVSIKPYSCCRSVHSSIDALSKIMGKHRLSGDDIKTIDVVINPFVLEMCGKYDVEPRSAAQLSIPYALAALQTVGKVQLDSYSEELRFSGRLASAMHKVNMISDASQKDDDEPIVRVTTVKDEIYEERVQDPLGSPTNPVTDEALSQKFVSMAKMSLGEKQAEDLLKILFELDQTTDLKRLESFLTNA